jgi:hypothetical protein
MWKIIRLISLVASLGISGWLTTYVSGSTERKQGPPSSKTEAGPSPSEILERRGQVKPAILNSIGEGLQSSVAAYINWAAASTQKDRETARRGLAEVRGNRQIGEAFSAEPVLAEIATVVEFAGAKGAPAGTSTNAGSPNYAVCRSLPPSGRRCPCGSTCWG